MGHSKGWAGTGLAPSTLCCSCRGRKPRGHTATGIPLLHWAPGTALYLVVKGAEVLEAAEAGVAQADQDGEKQDQEGEERERGLQTWRERPVSPVGGSDQDSDWGLQGWGQRPVSPAAGGATSGTPTSSTFAIPQSICFLLYILTFPTLRREEPAIGHPSLRSGPASPISISTAPETIKGEMDPAWKRPCQSCAGPASTLGCPLLIGYPTPD